MSCLAHLGAASLLLATCALRSQINNYAVVPPSYAAAEGNTLDREPFGTDQIRSLQYIDKSLLGAIPVNTTLVKEIAYRRDSLTAIGTMVRTRTLPPTWQMRLGNYLGNYLTQAGGFPAVNDTNYTIVYSAKQTVFPPLPLVNGGGPQNFDLKFPLDVLWQFKGPGLAIDHYCSEAAVGGPYTYYIDAIDKSTSGAGAGLIGPNTFGCPAGQNRAYGSAGSPGFGEIQLTLNGAPPSAVAIAGFGTSITSWNGLTLPYDLGAMGLPGCTVYSAMTLLLGTTTSGSGSAQYSFAIPANPLFAGAVLYGQWLVSDTRINPLLPVAVSDGIKFTVGNATQAAMTTVSVADGLQGGGTGFVNVGRGYPVRIGW